MTVRDTFGKSVPSNQPVAVQVNPKNREIGTIVGGVPSPNPDFQLFTTKAGGLVEFTYTSPVLTQTPFQTTSDSLGALIVDAGGNPTSGLGNDSIRLRTGGCTGGNGPVCFPSGFTGPLPEVLAVSPASGQVDVGTNAVVMAKFSQSLDPATVNAGTFSVVTGGIPVAGALAVSDSPSGSNTVVTLTPTTALAPLSVYDVAMTTGIQSAAGSPLLASRFTMFGTGLVQDILPPTVARVNPGIDLLEIPVNTSVNIEFSEPVNAVTVNSNTIMLSANGTPVAGRFFFGAGDLGPNTIVTFTPDVNLDSDTVYTLTVTSGLADVTDNALPADFMSSFTTVVNPPEIDNSGPVVLSWSPTQNLTVPLDIRPQVHSDERINPLSVVKESLGLITEQGRNLPGPYVFDVPGRLDISNDQRTVIFIPDQPLTPNSVYFWSFPDARFSGGPFITDIAGNDSGFGNPLAGFETGSTFSNPSGPTVLSVSPVDGDSGVPLNRSVVLQFSEPLAGSSVTAQTVLVSNGGPSLSGTVTLEQNNTAVRWVPSNPNELAPNIVHTVTVTTGVKNLALIPLAIPFTSTFTTGTMADTTPPTVVLTSPADGAVDVSRSTTIEVTFSEPVDPATVNLGTTVFLENSEVNGPIPGILTVSPDGLTVTYAPSFPLFANQLFTVRTLNVDDIVGNGSPEVSSTFTTAVAPGTDVNALPTFAIVTPADLFLPADGVSTTTVTLSNINQGGTLVADGTQIGVAVEPAYLLDSLGGSILEGTPSGADSRFRLFSTVGGIVSFTYQTPNFSTTGVVGAAWVQVANVDAAGAPISLMNAGQIFLLPPSPQPQ